MSIEDIKSGMIAVSKDRRYIGEIINCSTFSFGTQMILVDSEGMKNTIDDYHFRNFDSFNYYERIIDIAEPGDVIVDNRGRKLEIDDIYLNDSEEPYIVVRYGFHDEIHLYNEDIKSIITKEILNKLMYKVERFKSDHDVVDHSIVLPGKKEISIGSIARHHSDMFISQVTNIKNGNVYAKMHQDGFEYILPELGKDYNFYDKPIKMLKEGDMIFTSFNKFNEVNYICKDSEGNLEVQNSITEPYHSSVSTVLGFKEDNIKGVITKELIEINMFTLSKDLEQDKEESKTSLKER